MSGISLCTKRGGATGALLKIHRWLSDFGGSSRIGVWPPGPALFWRSQKSRKEHNLVRLVSVLNKYDSEMRKHNFTGMKSALSDDNRLIDLKGNVAKL